MPARRALTKLGHDIKDARRRRRIPSAVAAERSSISRMTLLKVEKGDELVCIETPGGIELTPYDPASDETMRAARRVAKRYRSALRELAR